MTKEELKAKCYEEFFPFPTYDLDANLKDIFDWFLKILEQEISQVKISNKVEINSLWQKERPDKACVFVTREGGEYALWRFSWEVGEPPEENADDDTTYYYLAWTTIDGDEWDDIDECNFDEYLILEFLPTLDQMER